jgi:hypothetical protein
MKVNETFLKKHTGNYDLDCVFRLDLSDEGSQIYYFSDFYTENTEKMAFLPVFTYKNSKKWKNEPFKKK